MRFLRLFAPMLVLATLLAGLVGTANTAHALAPTIQLSPNAVLQGAGSVVVQVGGNGFAPFTTVTVRLDGTVVGTTVADTNGAFGSGSMGQAVLFVTASLSVGQHTVTATDATSLSASQPFYESNLALSTSSAANGTQVTIAAQGLIPSSAVNVQLGGVTVLNTTTDGSGSFSAQSFTIPSLPIGSQQLVVRSVSGANTVTVSTAFTVTGGVALTLAPAVLPVGASFTLSGSGLPASQTVLISFDSTPLGTATTSASGALGPVQFAVPAGASIGTHAIVVRDSLGHTVASATLTVSTQPGVTVSPASGPPGGQVRITGAGFLSLEPVQVTIGSNVVAIVSASSTGAIDTTFSLPAALAAGSVTLTVTGALSHLTVSATYTVQPAALTLSAISGPAGLVVTASGQSFAPREAITLTFNGAVVATATADTAGAFQTTFTVPTGTALGAQPVVATGAGSHASASATFTVSGVSLTISPTSAIAREAVAASGAGFAGGETIIITLGGSTVATAIATAQGAFSTTVAIPATQQPGATTVVATGLTSRRTATAPLSVSVRPRGTLTVSPSTGLAGTPLALAGGGFQPGETVTIAVEGRLLATTTASVNGTIAASATLPATLSGGAHTIRAVGTSSRTAADAQITVVPALSVSVGSVAPGDSFRIDGHGYTPRESIQIAANGQLLATALADVNGSFAITVSLAATVGSGTVALTATGVSSRTAATVTVNAAVPTHVGSTTWYFAVGRTDAGFDEQLDILNVNAGPVNGTITLFYGEGRTASQSFSLQARTRATFDVLRLVGATQVSAVVQANLPVAAAQVIDRAGQAAMATAGVPAPKNTWYLAEGYTGLTFLEDLDLLNPGNSTAHVHIAWPLFNGRPPIVQDVVLAPRSRRTIPVNAYVPRASHATIVNSDVPIAVGRALLFGLRQQGGTAGLGVSSASTALTFAEGSTANGFEEYLTMLNPAYAGTAHVNATFYDRAGRLLGATSVAIDGLHRANIRVNDLVHDAAVSSVLTSDVPIVAERSMYFGAPNGSDADGTSVFGQTTPYNGWAFAAGDTRPGRSEFLLLFNPRPTPVTVQATWYADSGQVVERIFTIPATARLNIDLTLQVPELPRGLHGVVVRSVAGGPFFAEQALYDNNMANGAALVGTPIG